ncbi:hypothetical protein OIO89_00140, partial (plasmid) [Mycobacterium ulcerans]
MRIRLDGAAAGTDAVAGRLVRHQQAIAEQGFDASVSAWPMHSPAKFVRRWIGGGRRSALDMTDLVASHRRHRDIDPEPSAAPQRLHRRDGDLSL